MSRVAGEREPEAGEEQQVELDEGQARIAVVDAVGVEANERTGQREERDRAPGEEPEPELRTSASKVWVGGPLRGTPPSSKEYCRA